LENTVYLKKRNRLLFPLTAQKLKKTGLGNRAIFLCHFLSADGPQVGFPDDPHHIPP